MVAGGALYSPMTESFRVHDASVSPPVSVPDIQIASNDKEGQFGVDIERPENRQGMFDRMSQWFRPR